MNNGTPGKYKHYKLTAKKALFFSWEFRWFCQQSSWKYLFDKDNNIKKNRKNSLLPGSEMSK